MFFFFLFFVYYDIIENTCEVSGDNSAPNSIFLFLFSEDVENDLMSSGRLHKSFLLRMFFFFYFVFLDGSGGDPQVEVHYSQAHTACVRSPISVPTFLVIPVAHAYTNAYYSMAGPSCCPKAWNTTFVCLRLVFFSLNSINIYIAAEGVGSPSCRGGKLSLDENELQSSLPRHRLACLYLHYPAIPQLPLFLSC